MIFEMLRVAQTPPGQAVKIRHNSYYQLVWIACCDFSSGLAFNNKLPERLMHSLSSFAYILTKIFVGRLIIEHLVKKLKVFRMLAASLLYPGDDQAKTFAWRSRHFQNILGVISTDL